jgi:teichoic acid transport system permease protein
VSESTTSTAPVDDDDYSGTHHVYEPFRAGLPRTGPYVRELWRRRGFAVEASRATLRATQANTVLGQVWNVLNPLLLACVYYVLVFILSGKGSQKPTYFAHLLCGLFIFYFIANSMSGGAQSITAAGKMIMNTAFPRVLLPLASVRTALRKFLPTLAVLFVALMLGPVKLHPTVLVALPWFGFVLMFATGVAMLLATLQVYFRDTSSFLPYVTRIWLYTSPVLWFPEDVPSKLKALELLNPLYSIVGGWSQIIIEHEIPSVGVWLTALAWSVGALVLGGLVFLSRERDFAVRL